MKLIKDLLIYLVPFVLIVGTNFNTSVLDGINIAVGHSEVLIFLLLFYLFIDNKIIFPKKLIYAFLLGLFSILLSLIFSTKSISTISIIELVRWIEYFVLFICIYSLASIDNIKTSLYCLLIAATLFIAVCIFQASTFNFYEKRIYGTFISAANVSEESVSNPNVAAAFLVGCFLLFYSFKYLNIGIKRYFLALLQYATFVLVILTLSRSAFIGMVIGILVLLKLFNKNLIKYLMMTGLIIGVLLYLFFSSFSNFEEFVVVERAISTFDPSTNSGASVISRFENTSKTLDVALNNFLFGIGFGDLENQYNLVPDNFYVHIIAETGILGLLTSIILFMVIFKDLLSMIKVNITDKYFFHLVTAFFAVFITFLFENYAANLFRHPRLLGLFWYMLALIYKYDSIVRKKVDIK